MLELYLDLALVAGVLILAWLSVASSDLFKSIVLFICLGLLVTIAWTRLEAWDVAIAEAAIGAGITGALLLASLRKLEGSSNRRAQTSRGTADV